MKVDAISKELMQLPAQGQKEVFDFVMFLKKRYKSSRPAKKSEYGKLSEEPFIGMWRDRQDFNDSSNWVRTLRRNEWANQ